MSEINGRDIEEIIEEMTPIEKALLLSGRDFWFTRGIKKFGIKPYMMTDGPHGIRKQSQEKGAELNESVPATCFPPACTMASTWDTALIEETGARIGAEAKAEHVSVVLGPGANIKRHPSGGRNFEYLSEDPLLSGECAAALIRGIQSQGVGACVKHFAFNNQETGRMHISAVVDERAMREIYLASFETAVKKGKPRTMMCAYNKVNGTFCCESSDILTDILRNQWGYEGYVMSDWGASNDRTKGVPAGLELEMPGGSAQQVYKIAEAVESGKISREEIDTAARRMLTVYSQIERYTDGKIYSYDKAEHHNFSVKAATEGAVLLKNDGQLPLEKDEKIVVIGELFEIPRYQGNGSSLIKSHIVVTPKEAFDARKANYTYAKGYSVETDKPSSALEAAAVAAVNAAKGAKVLYFIGLTKFYESEGFDREHINLPKNQLETLSKVLETGAEVTVLLYGGAPVAMPFADKAKAIFNMYLPGQGVGEAAYKLIYGGVNPSGKLAETYPLAIEDVPSAPYFPMSYPTVEYRESIFVGYRYFASAKKPVLFPFGYGLSYTKFEYSDLSLESADGTVTASFTLKNVGKVAGKEIVQLYAGQRAPKVFKAAYELKAFEKVALEAGEEKRVTLTIANDSLKYYDVSLKRYVVENGVYNIFVGASSEDLYLTGEVEIADGEDVVSPYDNGKIADYLSLNGTFSDEGFKEVLKNEIPPRDYVKFPFDRETALRETKTRLLGRIILKVLAVGIKLVIRDKSENGELMRDFMRHLMVDTPLAASAFTSGGTLPEAAAEGLILLLNGKRMKGISKILKGMNAERKMNANLKKQENFERPV
ncbi:MAG: glycoside hydrolase family 3 C-terminal domain-containing protein [Christensenellaceae bacterium]|jgi:beta-glucosidase|nr:glycoside hydrolase family 3 C-terminal domain-containing protein [Christensenellaceae bacterium]